MQATGVEGPRPDAAPKSLLQSLVRQLDIDLAMISLRGDHMQYFLAGTEKDSIDFAEATLESSRWYGCDEVIHHGGLRTIAIDAKQHPSAIYEELDMAKMIGRRTCLSSTVPSLTFMSAFCTNTTSEVLRLQSHRLDRVKSDFLSSVSHEMRSPLHNTLGNLELLLQTDCSEE